ncbi:MAG: histidinol-phosphate transaminase [bacterium]|nr:histidinol-phosphate transaminase [bacterium]
MKYELNDKIKSLSPYSVDKQTYKIRLDANESFINLPNQIVEQLKANLDEINFNRYPDPDADELCLAYAQYYGLDRKYIVAGNGSDELISVIFSSFLKKSDSVVVLSPDFSMYKFYAHICECKVLDYPKCNAEIDVEELIEFCRVNNPQMIVFSNPCNPTSLSLETSQVKRVIENFDGLVVLDEAYMDFDDSSLIESAAQYDNLIVLRTCSKMMGLAALRVGFAVANEKIVSALRATKSPYNVNSVSQIMATTVLKNKKYLDGCRKRIIESRDFLYNALKPICADNGVEVMNTKTNFVFIKSENAALLFEYLKTKNILVRCFGKYLRITAGNENENVELVKEIKMFFKGDAVI